MKYLHQHTVVINSWGIPGIGVENTVIVTNRPEFLSMFNNFNFDVLIVDSARGMQRIPFQRIPFLLQSLERKPETKI